MQSYFRLSASSRLRRPLSIFGLPEQYQKATEKKVFDQLDQAIVAYFRAEAHEEFSDVLSVPAFLVSDELKKLFTLYVPGLQAKIIQLFAGEADSLESYRYRLPYFPPVSCLHESAERYPDGSVKQIILNQMYLPPEPIFRVGGILEYRIVVELSVAESILRRSPYGIDLAPVEVR